MVSNNVIAFPKAFNGPRNEDELSPEEILKNVDMMKQFHIKDGAFVIESLRSMMCKHYGIYHPFQKISENVFSPDEDDSGGLKIVDSLNITMKNDESN